MKFMCCYLNGYELQDNTDTLRGVIYPLIPCRLQEPFLE